MKKGILLSFLVAGFLLAGCGKVPTSTNTNQPTVNSNENLNQMVDDSDVTTQPEKAAVEMEKYTDKTSGFSLQVPKGWKINSGSAGDKGGGGSMDINELNISKVSKAKWGNTTLAQFAAQSPTPADKLTISDVQNMVIGDYNIIREKVMIDDPDLYSGYWFFLDTPTDFYTFSVVGPENIDTVEDMLVTFDPGTVADPTFLQ